MLEEIEDGQIFDLFADLWDLFRTSPRVFFFFTYLGTIVTVKVESSFFKIAKILCNTLR